MMVEAYHQRVKYRELEGWKRTREIIKMMYNTTRTKESQLKTAQELLPLVGDGPLPERKKNSSLAGFKAACERFGLPWNPKGKQSKALIPLQRSTLEGFKAACQRSGVAWNPKQKAEA